MGKSGCALQLGDDYYSGLNLNQYGVAVLSVLSAASSPCPDFKVNPLYLGGLRVKYTLRVAWLQLGANIHIQRDICLPPFPCRRESTFEFRQLFLNICFLGFPMDSRLRGNDGCWRRLWVGLVKFALKVAEVSRVVERSSESGFSDDLLTLDGFVGKAHATFDFRRPWVRGRRRR